MKVFELRDQIIADYTSYISSFISIRNSQLQEFVDQSLGEGLLWPEALFE
jgi:hypothetical protein